MTQALHIITEKDFPDSMIWKRVVNKFEFIQDTIGGG